MTRCKFFKTEKPHEFEQLINDWLNVESEKGNAIFVANVQQFAIGEIVTGLQQLPGTQPQVKYSFCLLVFYTV